MRRFVIQKHQATSLHYDFRLEVDGVFVSWAVPKGPSPDPRDKRLAMEVEDHKMSWGDFEGVIGPGYGAGAVIVWDRGTWKHVGKGSAKDAIKKGHISFELHGEKLKGEYSLRRIREGDKPQWLLVKKKDDEADSRDNPVITRPQSVVSGKTIEEIAAEE
jgi:DNA ligase D-like protein (predicted 3'-phosphoesterase)